MFEDRAQEAENGLLGVVLWEGFFQYLCEEAENGKTATEGFLLASLD